MVLCPISSCLVLRLPFPLPLGGGTRSKKKKVGRDACALPDPYGLFYMLQCEFQGEYPFFFLGLVPTSLLSDEKKKGEGLHTRAANATPPLRRLRPCQLLRSCGALPAVRDGLRTAVSAFGRFFA